MVIEQKEIKRELDRHMSEWMGDLPHVRERWYNRGEDCMNGVSEISERMRERVLRGLPLSETECPVQEVREDVLPLFKSKQFDHECMVELQSAADDISCEEWGS